MMGLLDRARAAVAAEPGGAGCQLANHPEWLERAEKNHEIVQRYGRFPGRDAILGRHPDLEEQE